MVSVNSPSSAIFKRRQHSFRPYRWFRPFPAFPGSGFSGLFRRICHWRRSVLHLYVLHSSTSLPPFAPRQLRRFPATMEALTPAQLTPPCRSPWLICVALRPFRRQPPFAPCHRFCTLPLSLAGFLPEEVWASPLMSRLAVTTGRIAFVILRTGSSPPVALHPTSR